jgi:hypothetical protein
MAGIIKILGVLTLVFIIFVAMDSLGIWRGLFSIGENGIRDLIEDEYPDADPNIEYTENCTICDDLGCRTYPEPCWKITIITEGEEGLDLTDILMDDSGEEKDKSTRPCTEWWCDAPPCRYTYSEESEGIEVSYTNSDCKTNDLSCDSQYKKCRSCQEGPECIATTVISEPGKTTYIFEILQTGEYAEIDSIEGVCRIYSRGSLIHSQSMDYQSCGSLMSDNTACYEGTCDFVPGFDLIQS